MLSEASVECRRWIRNELMEAKDSADYDDPAMLSCRALPKEENTKIVDEELQRSMSELYALAKVTKTETERFQRCIGRIGTADEKAAVKHVIKVEGPIGPNRIADLADVHTDYSRGQASEGQMIASAFTTCYKSITGLVTVYDKDGGVLAKKRY